jgi:ABC-type multidrug transport system fused ATPase/permease subunit
MTQSSDTPAGSRSRVAAHPVTSAIIAILILASIFFALYVPLYASATPKVGDFPFFYFYLLIYMPVLGVVMWIVITLQARLGPGPRTGAGPGARGPAGAGDGEVTR